jgi:hypothetical protein
MTRNVSWFFDTTRIDFTVCPPKSWCFGLLGPAAIQKLSGYDTPHSLPSHQNIKYNLASAPKKD